MRSILMRLTGLMNILFLQLTIPMLKVNGVNVKDRNSDIDWPDKSDVIILTVIILIKVKLFIIQLQIMDLN